MTQKPDAYEDFYEDFRDWPDDDEIFFDDDDLWLDEDESLFDVDDVSTQLFIGTSYLAKVTDHEFENGTEITVPFD